MVLCISALGCLSTKDISKLKEKDIVISLKKGACYGRCAVYNLDFYKDGFIVYEGLLHTEKYGIYSKYISKELLAELKKDFASIDFFNLPSEYPAEIVDLPMITMFHKNGKMSKTVSGRTERPKELVQLQIKLEKIANESGWKLEKAYTKDDANGTVINKEEIGKGIENQLIIEPAENVSLTNWFIRYQRYDLQLIERVAPDLDYWLVSFNLKLISQKDMIKLLKGDRNLKSVEVNRQIGERDR